MLTAYMKETIGNSKRCTPSLTAMHEVVSKTEMDYILETAQDRCRSRAFATVFVDQPRLVYANGCDVAIGR